MSSLSPGLVRLFKFLNMSKHSVTPSHIPHSYGNPHMKSCCCIVITSYCVRTLSCTIVSLVIPCGRFMSMLHIQSALDAATQRYHISC